MNAYSHENAALQAGRDRAAPANAWRDDHRRRAAKGKPARSDVKKRRNAPPVGGWQSACHQRGDTGKLLAFHPLEEGAASG